MDQGTESFIMEEKRNRSSSGFDSLKLFLVVLSLLTSIIAITLAASALTRKAETTVNLGSAPGSESGSVGKVSPEVWKFAIGHDGTSVEYIDDTTGTLRGFHVDIVNAVCAEAKKTCRLVWDIYSNCWTSEAGQKSRGGVGLMSGWYDACTGWFNTHERALTFQFTAALRKPYNGVFYVKPGNPGGFDPTNIRADQRIGFGDGWSQDEHCLARNSDAITGVPLDPSQILHFKTLAEIVAAVKSNQIDAAFVNENCLGDQLEQLGDLIITNCNRGGAAMMAPKDSTLSTWWNPAFEAIRQSGVYADICARIDTEHGALRSFAGPVICLD
ncbi:uncharacterized protein [Diadema antillarum]|uniref:uncharacterized protein n=1 Tax=Diadema antillarum TaxID=105358 RepID=UPI003A8365E9